MTQDINLRMLWQHLLWAEQNVLTHDDVIKWKHFPRYWPFVRRIHRSPVNSPHKDQWRGTLMFSLICVWINGWVNNREAGDLRRHQAHCDVIVMTIWHVGGRPMSRGHKGKDLSIFFPNIINYPLLALKLDYSGQTRSILMLLIPCVVRASATIILIVRDKQAIGLCREGFQLLVPISATEWCKIQIILFSVKNKSKQTNVWICWNRTTVY